MHHTWGVHPNTSGATTRRCTDTQSNKCMSHGACASETPLFTGQDKHGLGVSKASKLSADLRGRLWLCEWKEHCERRQTCNIRQDRKTTLKRDYWT
jgi:hypothetical protein